MENIGFEVPPPEARPQTPDELGVKGEGLSRLPSFGARPSQLGGAVAIAPAITAWNVMAFSRGL
jgi:hypothetical protein